MQPIASSWTFSSQVLQNTSSLNFERRDWPNFLSDPGIPGVRSMGLGVCLSPAHSLTLVDLTDVSLVDEDANPILADHTNRAIPGNLEMQVAPPGDQIWIKSNASGATWRLNLL